VLPNERDFRFDRFRLASVRLRLLLRKCLFLLEHFVSFLCKHDHREETPAWTETKMPMRINSAAIRLVP
jgi:hypothetical protein